MSADGSWIVPRSSVPSWIWNGLIAVIGPARLDESSGQ